MKTLLLLTLLSYGTVCHGQITFNVSDSTTQIPTKFWLDSIGYSTLYYDTILLFDQTKYDSLTAICKERGHVKSDLFSSTLMYCEPYIIDTDSNSVIVYPACNWNTYECMRCGKSFTEQEKERKQVLWRKPKSKLIIGDHIEVEYVFPIDTISSLLK